MTQHKHNHGPYNYDLLFDGTMVGLTLERTTSLTLNIHQFVDASLAHDDST